MPNIDVSTIEGFDAMTPEQKVEALLKVEVPEKIDMTQYVPKETSNNLASENKKLKDQLKAQMNDEQRAAAEREAKWAEMEAKLAALEKEKLESTYKASYLALGYDDALATETAKAMAEGNMAKVFENQKKAAEAAEKRIKAELMKNNPHPGGAGGGDGKTEDTGVELARRLGKAKADAQKDSNDILKNYL